MPGELSGHYRHCHLCDIEGNLGSSAMKSRLRILSRWSDLKWRSLQSRVIKIQTGYSRLWESSSHFSQDIYLSIQGAFVEFQLSSLVVNVLISVVTRIYRNAKPVANYIQLLLKLLCRWQHWDGLVATRVGYNYANHCYREETKRKEKLSALASHSSGEISGSGLHASSIHVRSFVRSSLSSRAKWKQREFEPISGTRQSETWDIQSHSLTCLVCVAFWEPET